MNAGCFHSSRVGELTPHQETALILLVVAWERFLGLLLGQSSEGSLLGSRVPPAPHSSSSSLSPLPSPHQDDEELCKLKLTSLLL